MHEWLRLSLRLVHIVGGALWVGMMGLNVFFLMPAVKDLGPDGGKIMAVLQRRRLMTVIPLLALATIISGLWLYGGMSGGAPMAFLTSRVGLAFGIGGLLSIIAFLLGIVLVRPAMTRMATLAQQTGSAQPEERQTFGAEMQRLRARSTMVSRVVMFLLLVAVGAMAVARYV